VTVRARGFEIDLVAGAGAEACPAERVDDAADVRACDADPDVQAAGVHASSPAPASASRRCRITGARYRPPR
jgi:hypothetical protein